MKCTLCLKEISDADDEIEAAIDAGWIPYFYAGDLDTGDEEHGPCCPECTDKYLSIMESGEWELLPGYEVSSMGHGLLKIVNDEVN